jgi:hypothetical protein
MYLPSVTCEINERNEFVSKALEKLVPRIFAKVVIINAPVAIVQTRAESEASLLRALADSPSFPSMLIKKKAIASSKPIVVMPADRDKNLLISSKFIAR